MLKQRATRSDVATRAGVSKSTVTFVLSDRRDIAIPESTRERVRRAAKELDYRPNAVAKALATGKMNAITIAFPNLIVPHYARVLRAFESLTNTHGYHLIASTIGHVNVQNVLPDLWAHMNNPSDALILVDMPNQFKPFINEMTPFEKPVVAMGIYDILGIDCVEVDMEAGASAAIEHLLSAKPGRLAFFGFGSDDEANGVMRDAADGVGDPRAIAYHRAMTASGRPLEVIRGSHTGRRAKIELLQEYIRRNGCPDAIFCYDDELALSAHYAMRRLGLRMPDDVLLVGCDGNEECEYFDPPISTIVQPIDAMCDHAWELLSRRLSGEAVSRQHVRLDAQLVIRASSTRN